MVEKWGIPFIFDHRPLHLLMKVLSLRNEPSHFAVSLSWAVTRWPLCHTLCFLLQGIFSLCCLKLSFVSYLLPVVPLSFQVRVLDQDTLFGCAPGLLCVCVCVGVVFICALHATGGAVVLYLTGAPWCAACFKTKFVKALSLPSTNPCYFHL